MKKKPNAITPTAHRKDAAAGLPSLHFFRERKRKKQNHFDHLSDFVPLLVEECIEWLEQNHGYLSNTLALSSPTNKPCCLVSM